MSTCNQLDLQTLGSQPIMPKNLPDHFLDETSLNPCLSMCRIDDGFTSTWGLLIEECKWISFWTWLWMRSSKDMHQFDFLSSYIIMGPQSTFKLWNLSEDFQMHLMNNLKKESCIVYHSLPTVFEDIQLWQLRSWCEILTCRRLELLWHLQYVGGEWAFVWK